MGPSLPVGFVSLPAAEIDILCDHTPAIASKRPKCPGDPWQPVSGKALTGDAEGANGADAGTSRSGHRIRPTQRYARPGGGITSSILFKMAGSSS
jgi:hypothetical protein